MGPFFWLAEITVRSAEAVSGLSLDNMNVRSNFFESFFRKTAVVIACLIFLANHASADRLNIGIILPLSGGLSEYGVALRNGIDLARKDQPAINDSIKFTFEDSQYDNKQALSAFDKLIAADRCDLIFVWGSGPSEAVAPIAEQRSFPLITLGEHNAAVGRSHVINFTNPSHQFSSALTQHLRARGYKKFAIVMTQITYFESLSRSFRDELKATESLSIPAAYSATESDFKTAIAKIKADKPDALGIYLLNGQVSLFYRQLAAMHLDLPTFGTDIFESTSEIAASEPTIEGAVFPHNLISDEFRTRYVSEYRTDVQLTTAGRGYDFANLVARKMFASGNELFTQLTQLTPQQGVGGKFRFVDTPEYGKRFEFPISVKKIVNGKPVALN